MPSRNFNEAREELCKLIAEISSHDEDPASGSSNNNKESDLFDQIEDILQRKECASTFSSDAAASNDICNYVEGSEPVGVTALMVACNKGQLKCLKQLAQSYQFLDCVKECDGTDDKAQLAMEKNMQIMIYRTIIIGDCLHASSVDGNNQAIHYSVACPRALEYLSRILIAQHSLKIQLGDSNGSLLSQFQADFKLLSQVNDHGDTPFMMAAASGDITVIRYWIQRLLSTLPSSSECSEFVQSSMKALLASQNVANDTALSLACGYGHFELVEYLLCTEYYRDEQTNGHNCDEINGKEAERIKLKLPLIQVTYEDIKRVKGIHAKNMKVESRIPDDRMQEFKTRQSNIQRCLTLLQTIFAKHAEEISISLLDENDIHRESPHGKAGKKKRKKKKKSSSNLTASPITNINTCAGDGGQREHFNDGDNTAQIDSSQIPISKPLFRTMEDGTIVSGGQDTPKLTISTSQHVTTGIPPEKSIDHLLRERCDDTLEEVMESLCLDASMLLLSPHALAMKLSPSQLEVIEKVLENQLKAVAQAKQIHDRLLSKPSNK